MNSAPDKMRTTGDDLSLFTRQAEPQAQTLASRRSREPREQVGLGAEGEAGAKPFFKIFQVPLTAGTAGLK